jgi:16S rRNA (adenine1518-N6/adenine1519-N6)-dimethyltransferase
MTDENTPRPLNARSLLREAGLSPKKSFGQNFLVADEVTAQIAAACVPDAEMGLAEVVELGAGAGALTSLLVLRAKHVTAVERDRDMLPILTRSLGAYVESGALTLLEADAAAIDVAGLLGTSAPRVYCGNLPYQITGRLITLACVNAAYIERAVFMVQEEVCDRLVAKPSTKEYGALSVFTQAAFHVKKLRAVSRGCFFPSPDVTSAVVVLTARRPVLAEETQGMKSAVSRAFQARRKTLRNAWRGLLPDAELAAAALRAGISLDARGETLDVQAFARIARELDALLPAAAQSV